ncbi:MAG: cupin domain-containing protein, partial [Pseudomonadota bacterium]|nr:cupin domain-containing protein [Pseudomonadota bacterium]
MSIKVIRPKKEDILNCVARFEDLSHTDKGLPDQEVEGFYRTFRNVVGFGEPDGEESFSPLGEDAKPHVSHLKPGFGLGYVSAVPGQGVMMHTHDTNETFIVIEGVWMFQWEGVDGDEEITLSEKDVVSFPPGIQRRFECKSPRQGGNEGMIMAVIGGDNPAAEFSPEAVDKMKEDG